MQLKVGHLNFYFSHAPGLGKYIGAPSFEAMILGISLMDFMDLIPHQDTLHNHLDMYVQAQRRDT